MKATIKRCIAALGLLLLTSGCGLDDQGLFTKGYIPESPAPPSLPQVAVPQAMPSGSASPAAGPTSLAFVANLEQMPGYQQDKDKKNPSPNDPASIARGKEAFASNCAVCHGDKGEGDGANSVMLPSRPRNLTNGLFIYGGEDWQIYRTIAEGIPPSAMLPWKDILADEKSDQGIWDVVNYVKTLQKAPAK